MWVITAKGDGLVNLSQVTTVRIGFHPDPQVDGKKRVYAESAADRNSGGVCLFEGTPDECRQFVLWLRDRLPLIDRPQSIGEAAK